MNYRQTKSPPIWENIYFLKESAIENVFPDDSLVYFVMKGNFKLVFNHSEQYDIHSREMFIVRGELPSKLMASESSQLMLCRIPAEFTFASQALMDKSSAKYEENDPRQFIKFPIKKIVMRFLCLLNDSMKCGLNTNYYLELKLQELILLLFANYEIADLAQFLHSILSKDFQFKKIVMNNYLSAKNVPELAVLANYSCSGFIKKFKQTFSESPYQWMQKQKAKHILLEINKGAKSLQEIANEYKFSSYQHFAVFCKSQFGFPPTQITGINNE
jgi:AraC-like DNA-binding protein